MKKELILTASSKYTSWDEYYLDLVKDLPMSQGILSSNDHHDSLENILKSLPSTIEPFEYYREVNKLFLNPKYIEDKTNQEKYQFILDAIGQLILALEVVPKLFKIGLDFSKQVAKLIELYKFLRTDFQAKVEEHKMSSSVLKNDLYVNYLSYSNTIDSKYYDDYKVLVNNLLHLMNLPYLFVSSKGEINNVHSNNLAH